MKKLTFLLCLIIILNSCRQFKPPVPQFVLSGNIENFDGESIKLVHPLDNIIFEVDTNGFFSDTIYDFVDGYYNLVIGKESTKVFIKDGFDLHFDIDVNEFDESIKYKGIGANENNYLAQEFLNTEGVRYYDYFKFSKDTFVQKIDSFGVIKQNFLANYIASIPELDIDFIKFEKAKNQYFVPLQKENYVSYHKYYNRLKEFSVPKEFYAYRKELPLENLDLFDIENYFGYVNAYTDNQIAENDTMEYAFAALRVINREIHDNVLKKKFIFKSAKQNMIYVKKLDEYWALISYMVTDKRDLKELKKIKRSLDKIAKGKDVPPATFKDENDLAFSINDFKGKIIYIDCWAQWCGPCKKEIPFYTALEEKFADKDITFLKLSFDTDIDAWKKFIKEQKLEDNAYILDDNWKSEFAKTLMINGIPRFILLDKELKIIDSNASRPSSDDITKQLETLLL